MKDLSLLQVPLPIEYLDFRIQSINKGGYATILPYKDARVDMKILDDVVGIGYWQKKYEIVNGSLFCSIGIYNHDISQWIWKQDVGVESYTEKEKGQASDAFKRACFNLGIGRELYDYPLIQVKLNDNEFEIKNEKPIATWNLRLKEWTWYSQFDNNKLSYLGAKDDKNKLRFQFGTFKK